MNYPELKDDYIIILDKYNWKIDWNRGIDWYEMDFYISGDIGELCYKLIGREIDTDIDEYDKESGRPMYHINIENDLKLMIDSLRYEKIRKIYEIKLPRT